MNISEVEKDEEDFIESLNDIYGMINICGYEYEAGRILREIDPIAFQCGLSDQPLQYQCGECNKIYEEDDQDAAEECCLSRCTECDIGLPQGENNNGFCADCGNDRDEHTEEEKTE